MSGGGGGGPSAEQKALQRQQIEELNQLKIREWKAKNAILRGRRGRASLLRNIGGEAGIAKGDTRAWKPVKRVSPRMIPKPKLIRLPDENPRPKSRTEAMRSARHKEGSRSRSEAMRRARNS